MDFEEHTLMDLGSELRWCNAHEAELLRSYEGKFVAVSRNSVRCSANTADEAVLEATEQGLTDGQFVVLRVGMPGFGQEMGIGV